MKRRYYKIGVLGLIGFLCVALFFSSCFVKPKLLAVENANILGIKDEGMEVEMDFTMYNPSMFNAKVYDVDMDTYYNGEKIGNAVLENETSLPSGDTVVFHMNVIFDLEKLEQYYAVLLDRDSTVFNIKGKNKVGFLGRKINIYADEDIVIDTKSFIHDEIQKNLSKSGNFEINSIHLNRLPTLSKLMLKVNVQMINDLSIDYKIVDADLTFYESKRKRIITTWELDENISLDANSMNKLPIDIELDNINTLKSFNLSWLGRSGIEVIVKGNVVVDIDGHIFNIPIEKNKSIKMNSFSLF